MDLMDQGCLQVAQQQTPGVWGAPEGCRLLAEGPGRKAPSGPTWLLTVPDLCPGASSPPSAAPRPHLLPSAAPACPTRPLSFWALPFALSWSHLFTLPSLPVTPKSPSLYHSHPFCPLSPHSSPLPWSPFQRTLPTEMLRTPRAGSALRRTFGPPLPPPWGRGRQVSAPSFPQ